MYNDIDNYTEAVLAAPSLPSGLAALMAQIRKTMVMQNIPSEQIAFVQKAACAQFGLTLSDFFIKQVDPTERCDYGIYEFLQQYGSVENKPTKEVYAAYHLWRHGGRNLGDIATHTKFTQYVIKYTGLESRSVWHRDGASRSACRCFCK